MPSRPLWFAVFVATSFAITLKEATLTVNPFDLVRLQTPRGRGYVVDEHHRFPETAALVTGEGTTKMVLEQRYLYTGELFNPNTATVETLDGLPKVSAFAAREIVALSRRAPIRWPHELHAVRGLSSQKVEALSTFFTKPPWAPARSINHSSAAALQRVKGIGEVRARLIISNRPYTDVSDLLSLRGVGPRVLSGWRGELRN